MSPLTTITPTEFTLTNLTTFAKTYQVRDGITVTIEPRRERSKNDYDEARAVFSRPGKQYDHDVVLLVYDLFQIARICGFPHDAEVPRDFQLEPQKAGGADFDQTEPWKEYKVRDLGWKTNLLVIDNSRLELEHKYGGKGEPWSKLTLLIGDVLAALRLITGAADGKERLGLKVFFVEGQPVLVERLHEPGGDKPHQVLVQTELQGITKQQLTSYEALSSADCDFACFDDEAAEKLVARFHRFLNTVKGKKLAAE